MKSDFLEKAAEEIDKLKKENSKLKKENKPSSDLIKKAAGKINKLKKENKLLKEKRSNPEHFDVMNDHLFWLALWAKISIVMIIVGIIFTIFMYSK